MTADAHGHELAALDLERQCNHARPPHFETLLDRTLVEAVGRRIEPVNHRRESHYSGTGGRILGNSHARVEGRAGVHGLAAIKEGSDHPVTGYGSPVLTIDPGLRDCVQ